MECLKCSSCVFLEEHHVHPIFMNNPLGKGEKIMLCRDCHQILHQRIIPSIIWLYVQDYGYHFASWKHKNPCIEAVKRRTEQWLKEKL